MAVRVSRIATPRFAIVVLVLSLAFAAFVAGWAATQGQLTIVALLVGAGLLLWPAAAWRWLSSATVRFDPAKHSLRGEVDDAADVPVEQILDVAVERTDSVRTVTGLKLRDGTFATLFHSSAPPPVRSIELVQELLERARRAHPSGSGLPWRTPRVFAVGASGGLWALTSSVPLVAIFLAGQLGFGPGLLVVTLLALLAGTALMRALGSATVLADGIAVRRAGRRLFLSFSEMGPLERVGNTPKVSIGVGAKRVALSMRSGGAFFEEATRRRQDFLERATEAVPVELLKEAAREGEPEGAYRTAELRASDLWRVAENPAAPVLARIHAVAALRVAEDTETRERVDAVIAVTGDPKVRVALEQAAAAVETETEEDEEGVEPAAPAGRMRM
jgi:hypothetical protein